MKWIKATNRLPDKVRGIVFRWIDTKELMTCTIIGLLGYCDSDKDHIFMLSRYDLKNIEWLDESKDKASEKINSILAAAELQKSIQDASFQDIQATMARVRRDAEAVPQLVHALRDLHDLQNGPPPERDLEDWNEVMARVAELLKKYETE